MLVDKAMRDSHNREVREKKDALFEERRERMEEKCHKTEKRIKSLQA
jgi:hypothetical protein